MSAWARARPSARPSAINSAPAALERVDLLGRRWGLGADELRRLAAFSDLISDDEGAPTAIRDPAAVAEDHLADSLVALELAPVRAARRIADLGSGPGLPGLALAIALPDATVWLIESNRRKCAFLERALEASRTRNARVVNLRAEEWDEGIGTNDLVTARALAPLPVVAEYSAPLLRPGAAALAWRGRRDAAEERRGARAAAELGLELHEPWPVHPYPGANHRYLHLLLKVRDTPHRFPRRAGVARKRPLGGARAPASTSDRP